MGKQVDIEQLKQIARDAGEAVLEVYGTEFTVDVKDDQSPLTEADRRSHQVIVRGLQKLYPDIPMISEESEMPDYAERKDWEYFWLVDPLDGTKEFIKRNGEFTVNIALIHGDKPLVGIVYQPVGDRLFWGRVGEKAWTSNGGGDAVQMKGGPHYSEKENVIVVASRSHLTQEVKDFVADLERSGKQVEFLSAGSSLKLCLVAEGGADVYPRMGPTMEWDTGAAHAIALASGRKVTACETGEALLYNKENLLNPFFLVE